MTRPTNILIVLLDDVGFADFGCYGSEIATPSIDALAEQGTRFTNFHTTAMCSTTRAALLTGRNHHAVGMGCLANFDTGLPGYRGKISRSAGTLPEMLRPHGYRNYMIGKWHVTPLTESGPTGPFNGWPLGRGFDRFYGFLDAETDQYSPELIRDNSHITAPGTFETGYHLTEDLVDQSITMLAEHRAGAPTAPWLMWLAPGACHAPHQAPKQLIDHYESIYAKGWDQMRADRLGQQIELGIVPEGTQLPPRNDMVQAWNEHSPEEQRLFSRLGGAYAAMLDHFDHHLGRLVDFIERTGQRDNTAIIVMSDNGASQEGGPHGFVNAMGPFNLVKEDIAAKVARIDDIGGPDTHSNFPWGFAMAANTPLKRYKQNTHGGGIRDPLVVAWPGIDEPALRHEFCHASDLTPTILDRLGLDPPSVIDGAEQQPLQGTSFAATNTPKLPQYFEMFGHRGLVHDGWKAVAYHRPGTPFEDDTWELYHLDEDFSETTDLAVEQPEHLARLQALWWAEAEANHVLPLDDRFAERFAENVERHRAGRTRYEFWAGMGHLPSDVAPDLRNRSYSITAHVEIPDAVGEGGGCEGVLVAHGDLTSGYSLFIEDGHLVHDLNVGGNHEVVRSDRPVPAGQHTLGFRLERIGEGVARPGVGTLLIDGEPVGSFETERVFFVLISWSGLDIGLDRGSPVSHYQSPFEFTGTLDRVVIDLDDDQELDPDAVLDHESAAD